METQTLKNNIVINFASRLNTREILSIVPAVLKVIGLSVLNREVVRLNTRPQAHKLVSIS